MDREVISEVPGLHRQLAPVQLSPAVRYGDLVYVSGQPPVDPETGEFLTGSIEEQTHRVMQNLELILETAGSSLDHVLKTTVLCTDSAYFLTVNEIYGSYFSGDRPARTFFPVNAFPYDFDIEIECVAAVANRP